VISTFEMMKNREQHFIRIKTRKRNVF